MLIIKVGENIKMPKVEVIVKINDADINKMPEIVKECQTAGMQIEQQMKAVGMISGSIEQAGIGKLEKIKGVSYVEESKSLSI
jgi:hypothetical protein